MTRGAAIRRGLLVTLASPPTWPLALATFLIRGGIILVLVPIVVVPTPVGIGTSLGPVLTALALGQVPVAAVVGAAGIGLVVILWLFGGGWLAAALEGEGARMVAADDDVAHEPPRPRAGAILAARLVAGIPLLLAIVWGSFRLVLTTYRELTSPRDVETPIVVRVLAATPEVVVLLVVTWMAAEIVGAIAARRIALTGDRVSRSLVGAVGGSLRHPVAVLARFWIPTLVLVLVIVPSIVATAAAWTATGDALADGRDPVRIAVSVVALVALFGVGLLLASVVSAWRAAVWTIAETVSQRTFGGSSDRRPGDWRTEGSSATL